MNLKEFMENRKKEREKRAAEKALDIIIKKEEAIRKQDELKRKFKVDKENTLKRADEASIELKNLKEIQKAEKIIEEAEQRKKDYKRSHSKLGKLAKGFIRGHESLKKGIGEISVVSESLGGNRDMFASSMFGGDNRQINYNTNKKRNKSKKKKKGKSRSKKPRREERNNNNPFGGRLF